MRRGGREGERGGGGEVVAGEEVAGEVEDIYRSRGSMEQ